MWVMKRNQTFYILFKEDYFNKGDILIGDTAKLRVLKAYHNTWWRRLLRKFGIPVKIRYVKVTTHEEN